jgi:anti-anti-sigma factor
MEIRKEWLLGAPLLIVVGDVDHSTAWELDNTIQQSRQGDDSRLFVDLTGCDYIDSGGLAVFLSLAGKVRSDGFLGVIGAEGVRHRRFDEGARHPYVRGPGAGCSRDRVSIA